MLRGCFSFSNSTLSCLWFAFFLLQCWVLPKPKRCLPTRSALSSLGPVLLLLSQCCSPGVAIVFLWISVASLMCPSAYSWASSNFCSISKSEAGAPLCLPAVSLGYFDVIFPGCVWRLLVMLIHLECCLWENFPDNCSCNFRICCYYARLIPLFASF